VASETILAAKPTIPAAAPIVVAAYTRRRKGVIIRDPEEELSLKTSAETPKVKDKGNGILVETSKPMKKKDQIELDAEYARKLHEEINRDEFNKDIDWDAAMDHVNQKSNNPQKWKCCLEAGNYQDEGKGQEEDDSEVQEVVEVVTTAKLITEVVTTAASQVSVASETILAAKPTIPAAAPIVVAAYTRRRKGVIIRDPEEELSLKTSA
nr:hypothetical protein [Tanacetum cinerariifolium]